MDDEVKDLREQVRRLEGLETENKDLRVKVGKLQRNQNEHMEWARSSEIATQEAVDEGDKLRALNEDLRKALREVKTQRDDQKGKILELQSSLKASQDDAAREVKRLHDKWERKVSGLVEELDRMKTQELEQGRRTAKLESSLEASKVDAANEVSRLQDQHKGQADALAGENDRMKIQKVEQDTRILELESTLEAWQRDAAKEAARVDKHWRRQVDGLTERLRVQEERAMDTRPSRDRDRPSDQEPSLAAKPATGLTRGYLSIPHHTGSRPLRRGDTVRRKLAEHDAHSKAELDALTRQEKEDGIYHDHLKRKYSLEPMARDENDGLISLRTHDHDTTHTTSNKGASKHTGPIDASQSTSQATDEKREEATGPQAHQRGLHAGAEVEESPQDDETGDLHERERQARLLAYVMDNLALATASTNEIMNLK